ncbi:MAG: hypothetical protein M9924_02445 [Rhizobiaceae bacterium]|nr:hypothetical protein [Rhizobiaceae bacterium]
MRFRVALAISASLVTGQATASSILHIEGNGAPSSRSIIVAPQPSMPDSIDVLEGEGMARVSRSVIAVGEPSEVSDEHVAAISAGTAPVVLRGGVYGEALPAPVAEPEPEKKLSRPAQRKQERDERRAVREAIRFGEPLPQKAETQAPAEQQSGG